MIPKNTTPIKHKILTEIFAKRKLTLDEIAIASYIMRWSWGFDNGERRQDWTKKLTKRKIAKNIGMDEGQFNKVINRMIIENKIIVKDKCYQFNEHYNKWKLDKKSSFSKLDKKASKTCGIVKLNLTNSQVKLDKSSTLGMPNNQGEGIKNKDVRGGEHTSKDTLKDNVKKTLKEKGTIFIKTWKDFKAMRKKIRKPMTERAEELLIKTLDELSNNEKEQVNILNQSIMNSWVGIWPLKMSMDESLNKMWEKEDKYKHLEEIYNEKGEKIK